MKSVEFNLNASFVDTEIYFKLKNFHFDIFTTIYSKKCERMKRLLFKAFPLGYPSVNLYLRDCMHVEE